LFRNVVFSIGRLIDTAYGAAGTCILINRQGLLVTAAHVVNGSDENLVIRLNTTYVADYQDTTIQQSSLIPVKIEAIDPLRDVCVLSLKGQVPGQEKKYFQLLKKEAINCFAEILSMLLNVMS